MQKKEKKKLFAQAMKGVDEWGSPCSSDGDTCGLLWRPNTICVQSGLPRFSNSILKKEKENTVFNYVPKCREEQHMKLNKSNGKGRKENPVVAVSSIECQQCVNSSFIFRS